MINPIMQALNAASRQTQNSNNILGRLLEIKKAMSGKAPEVIYNQMMQNNPAFAQFVQQNAGKSPQQLAMEYGIDMNTMQSILK